GVAQIRRGRPVDAPRVMLAAARDVTALDPGQALELLLDAAWAAHEGGDQEAQLEITQLAATVAPAVGDERAAFIADLLAGLGALAEGKTALATAPLERVIAYGVVAERPRHVVWAGSAATWIGDPRGQMLLERGAALARARGAFGILASALGTLGLQQF